MQLYTPKIKITTNFLHVIIKHVKKCLRAKFWNKRWKRKFLGTASHLYVPLVEGIGFAFSCLYAAMLVKTNRIARIFSQATRSAQRPSCISPISQVFLTALLAGVQLFGSLIWLLIVPPGIGNSQRSLYWSKRMAVLEIVVKKKACCSSLKPCFLFLLSKHIIYLNTLKSKVFAFAFEFTIPMGIFQWLSLN